MRFYSDIVSKDKIVFEPCSFVLDGVDLHAYISCSNSNLSESYQTNSNPYLYPTFNIGDCSGNSGSLVNKQNNSTQSNKISIDQSNPTGQETLSAIPNPTDASLKIQYTISENSYCSISILNDLGEIVTDIVNTPTIKSGCYSLVYDTSRLPSSLYFITMHTKQSTITKQIMVIH